MQIRNFIQVLYVIHVFWLFAALNAEKTILSIFAKGGSHSPKPKRSVQYEARNLINDVEEVSSSFSAESSFEKNSDSSNLTSNVIEDDKNVTNSDKRDSVGTLEGQGDKSDDEEDDDEEEERLPGVAGIAAELLGGLSTPEGNVDVEGVSALISGLSRLREDGNYDFTGLTDLLSSFISEENTDQTSNFGAFLGGVVGAVLRATSSEDGTATIDTIDLGGFTSGLVKTVMASSAGNSTMPLSKLTNIKVTMFRIMITSINNLYKASVTMN